MLKHSSLYVPYFSSFILLIVVAQAPSQTQQQPKSLIQGSYIVTKIGTIIPAINILIQFHHAKLIVEGCNWHTSTYSYNEFDESFKIEKPFFSTQFSKNTKQDGLVIEALKNSTRVLKNGNLLTFKGQNFGKVLSLRQTTNSTSQNVRRINQCALQQKKSTKNKKVNSKTPYRSSKTGSWFQRNAKKTT